MYILALANSTENQQKYQSINLETQITNIETQIVNATNILLQDLLINWDNMSPYLIAFSIILGVILCFFPCFFPCLLCKTIKCVPSTIWRVANCLTCCRNKDKFKKLDIVEVKENDKEQKLICA